MFKNLLSPVKIGNLEIKNRMVQPAMGTNLASTDGTVSDKIVEYYAKRASGGVGLIITEICLPDRSGKNIPGELEASSDIYIPGLNRLAEAAHAGGAKIALQLAHAGCFASRAVSGIQPITPSGDETYLRSDEDKPRTMTIEDIKEMIKAYGMAAYRAKLAGFDAVELHGAHGYLPLEFLSAYTNHRTDEYGGDLKNRARFALECIQSIKEHAGESFPLIYRLSALEDVPNGITIDEAGQFAKWAEEAGVDAIHVTAGTFDSRMPDFYTAIKEGVFPKDKRLNEGVSIGVWVPPTYVPRGTLVHLAEKIKGYVSVPVIAVCGITPEMGEQILTEGKADLIAIGRQAIADPDYPQKVFNNKPEEIRQCVRCNECLGSVLDCCGINCTVNPEAGKEHEVFSHISKAEKAKKVLVIGGGPAGMEAARVAAKRGHDVTLCERETELGGMLRVLSIPEFKKDFRAFLKWQISELERQHVKVITNKEVTIDYIKAENPDTVVVATGARSARPNIKGIDNKKVFDAIDVLKGNLPNGNEVIVCGSGFIGTETAIYLAENMKKVTLVSARGWSKLGRNEAVEIVPEVEEFTRLVIKSKLVENGIKMLLNYKLVEIDSNQVKMLSYEGQEIVLDSEAVVLALGMESNRSLVDELRKLSIEVIPVGDAVKARKVINAVHEGYHAGRRI